MATIISNNHIDGAYRADRHGDGRIFYDVGVGSSGAPFFGPRHIVIFLHRNYIGEQYQVYAP